MGKKYFTLSFDDGLEQDKRIIQLMKEFGLKGTFNLNSGLFGTRGEVKGIGKFFFQDCEEGVKHGKLFSYVPHNRIPENEIVEVYQDMEIASHSYRHEPLGRIGTAEMRESIDLDIQALERMIGRKIMGHAYANGSTSETVQSYLKEKGILYARGVLPSNKFDFPENRMNLRPTCSCLSKNALALIEKFKAARADDDNLLLYMWGHAYEFDYKCENGGWDYAKRLFDAIAGKDDIVYCTNAEAFIYT